MTVRPTTANDIHAQANATEQENMLVATDSNALKESNDNRHGAATTARQWQVLSQLQRNRWVGTTHIYEQLMMAGGNS